MLLSCNSRKTATTVQKAELIGEQKIWVDNEKKESEETQKRNLILFEVLKAI